MTNGQKRQNCVLRKLGLVALVVVFGFSIVILHSPLSFAEEKPQLSAEQINQNFEDIRAAGSYFQAAYICTLLGAGALVICSIAGGEEGYWVGISLGTIGSIASFVFQFLAAHKLSSVSSISASLLTSELNTITLRPKPLDEIISDLVANADSLLKRRYKIPLTISHSIIGKTLNLSISASRKLEDNQVENLKEVSFSLAHRIALLCQESSQPYDFTVTISDSSIWLPDLTFTVRFRKTLSFDEALALDIK